jgi:hypothetical protein
MAKRSRADANPDAIKCKLREADFFLHKMVEASDIPDEYGFYLSAFLSAVYSTRERLHQIGGFTKKEQSLIQQQLCSGGILHLLCETRNVEVHKDGIRINRLCRYSAWQHEPVLALLHGTNRDISCNVQAGSLRTISRSRLTTSPKKDFASCEILL